MHPQWQKYLAVAWFFREMATVYLFTSIFPSVSNFEVNTRIGSTKKPLH